MCFLLSASFADTCPDQRGRNTRHAERWPAKNFLRVGGNQNVCRNRFLVPQQKPRRDTTRTSQSSACVRSSERMQQPSWNDSLGLFTITAATSPPSAG